MHVCYQLFSKTTGLNCMKFSGTICHHPRTNRLDFGSNQIKVQRSRSRKGRKLLDHELHEIFRDDFFIIQGPIDYILGAIRSKVNVMVTKRSKTYFCHNTLSFCPVHMKPTPKCSLFNSLSSDVVTNVALAKVCALPSARSSLPHDFLHILCSKRDNSIYLAYHLLHILVFKMR